MQKAITIDKPKSVSNAITDKGKDKERMKYKDKSPKYTQRQTSNNSLKSNNSSESSSSFFGSNHGEISRQLLSKSRTLTQPMKHEKEEEVADPDFLPLKEDAYSDTSEDSVSQSALEDALLDMGDTSFR